jgi:hypothetical protein
VDTVTGRPDTAEQRSCSNIARSVNIALVGDSRSNTPDDIDVWEGSGRDDRSGSCGQRANLGGTAIPLDPFYLVESARVRLHHALISSPAGSTATCPTPSLGDLAGDEPRPPALSGSRILDSASRTRPTSTRADAIGS